MHFRLVDLLEAVLAIIGVAAIVAVLLRLSQDHFVLAMGIVAGAWLLGAIVIWLTWPRLDDRVDDDRDAL